MFRKLGVSLVVASGVLLLLLLALAGLFIRSQSATPVRAGLAPVGAPAGSSTGSPAAGPVDAGNGILVGQSYKNDVSPALRDLPAVPANLGSRQEGENENPPIRIPGFKDQTDSVVQRAFGAIGAPMAMPAPILNFEGIDFPGVACNCAPPDTDGEVGATQYVQMVNEGYQVFDKNTGASLLGPNSIVSLWSGFGGVCETAGDGDPVVVYDQIANRWVLSQFAGSSVPTDQCIAVSTTSDATGSYYRYGFHLGSNFFDYPKLSVWPDGYYLSDNVFNSLGTSYLGPEPFVFNRSAMLNGQSASFQTRSPLGGSVAPFLPSDLDGSTLPPAGSPNYYEGFGNPMPLYKFHVDWNTPANTTFTNYANLSVAGFTQLCPSTRNCVAQPSTTTKLDGIGDRLMFRLAYRNFGDHEALISNHSVDVGGGQAGVRWYEIRNPATSPVVYQQGSYAPDATSRWMGSVAMDASGDIAVGYSASSSSVFPSLRYAGRLVTDPLGQLAQGEVTLFTGLGSQSGTSNRWGDYSDMTVDPVDDCTFWYTNEYYPSGVSQFNWRTRIGNFKFAGCGGTPPPTPTNTPVAQPTNTPVPPTATPVPVGDFTLSVAPTSRTVARGNSTTYTVTIGSVNGFTGNVNLSVSGLPNKATGSFSPNPVTGGSGPSTLTVTTQRGGPTGTFTLTITGTSGGLSHSQTVTLTITR